MIWSQWQWWQWALYGTVGYFVLGTATGCVLCYMEGRDESRWDPIDFVMPFIFWPVVWPVGAAYGLLQIGRASHRLGSTRKARKARRHEEQVRKQAKAEIAEIAKEYGITSKELTR